MNIVADLGLLLMTTQKDEEQIKQYSSRFPIVAVLSFYC